MLSRSKGRSSKIRPADVFLLVFLVATSLSGMFFIKEVMPKSTTVQIDVNGKPEYTLSIEKDSITEVKGARGSTFVEINNGKVRVTESECPGKVCVKQGWVDRGVIVCVPNRVVVRLDAPSGRRDLDAVTE